MCNEPDLSTKVTDRNFAENRTLSFCVIAIKEIEFVPREVRLDSLQLTESYEFAEFLEGSVEDKVCREQLPRGV